MEYNLSILNSNETTNSTENGHGIELQKSFGVKNY